MAVYTDLIKELRRDKKLTQEQVGAYFGISGPMFSLYENGHRRMNIDMLSQLADILGTSTDYLLGRTDEPNSYPKSKRGR